MAFHSKKEFAKLCGVRTGDLSNYIKRGKVVLSGEYIDDTNEVNAAFIEKRTGRPPKTTTSISPPPKITAPEKRESKKQPPKPSNEEELVIPDSDIEIDALSISLPPALLDKIDKITAIQKKAKEIAILELREQKIRGEVVPTEVVKSLFIQFSKGMMTAFQQAADAVITEVSHKKKLSSKDEASLRGKLITITNKYATEGRENSKKGIENIVNEYAEKRGRGEKK